MACPDLLSFVRSTDLANIFDTSEEQFSRGFQPGFRFLVGSIDSEHFQAGISMQLLQISKRICLIWRSVEIFVFRMIKSGFY